VSKKYGFVVFGFELCKTSDGCTFKKDTGALLDKYICPEVPPVSFLKALSRFFAQLKSLTKLQFSDTSDRWLHGHQQPSEKESTPLEPAEKVLNVVTKHRRQKIESGGKFRQRQYQL